MQFIVLSKYLTLYLALQGINFHPNVKGTGQPVTIAAISDTIDLEEDTASQFIALNLQL